MKIKHLLLIVAVLVLVLGVSACTRSRSTPPPSTETPAGSFPIPGTQNMGAFEPFGTQTALAREQEEETPTPPPPFLEDPTPTPGVVQVEPTAQVDTPQPVVPTDPPVQVPTATPGRPTTYTLQGGEHPYCIARRFDVDPGQLLSLNGLGTRTVTYPGLELRIPQSGSFPGTRALRAHPTTYTVQSGDTIYRIACLFGDVDPLAIATANSLSAPYTLTTGTTIHIP
jgi:LysM repeat protein